MFIISIIVNKDRILEDYDEFNHWGLIVKNMFIYNTYGTNPETIVKFNEYPPFTAIFQYIFLVIQKIYREDSIIIAQNVLYFSIMIPITKNITWGKSLKNIFVIVPLMVFMPMIFYQNFYLEILVDGTLGIMFSYVIFKAFEKEEKTIFKYLQILTGEIMLCLTKTSGVALAALAIIIILLKVIIDRKKDKKIFKQEIQAILLVVSIILVIVSIWYIKINKAEKNWDFNQYVAEDTNRDEKEITKSYIRALFSKQTITEHGFTVVSIILVFLCIQSFVKIKVKDDQYKYYSGAMIISIIIFLMFLLMTYNKIFTPSESSILTCFERYTATMLLSYANFQLLVITGNIKESCKTMILLTITIIIALIPMGNFQKKYIDGANYVVTSKINRNIYTRIKKYKNVLNVKDKILFISGPRSNIEFLKVINEYEIMPIKIEHLITGDFGSLENFEKSINGYTYVYIYRMTDKEKEMVKSIFKNGTLSNDTLYKVNIEKNKNILEMVSEI